MPILFDTAIINYTRVNISCGDPNMGLELELRDLVRLVYPKFAPIVDVETLDSQATDPGAATRESDSSEQVLAAGELQ